jgi:hypothetical protein
MGVGQIILALSQHSSRVLAFILLLAMAAFLTRPVLHLPWLVNADSIFKRTVRTVFAMSGMVLMVVIFGWFSWPPVHRHTLTSKEQEAFKKGLQGLRTSPPQTVQFSCPTYDERDCEYASQLIPLFGRSGWKVASTVQRITLARPKPGIMLVQHSGSGKPPDPYDWNQSAYVAMTQDLQRVRQAFNNIGIEPDSSWAFEIPEGQLTIYVGTEREDESAPTELTKTMAQIKQLQKEHP